MTRLSLVIAIGLVVASLQAAAQSGDAEKLFAAAQHKETTEGDLKAAIALYEEAASQAGQNRALAAQALLGMAESYRKLGDAQALPLFARIVREYPDQPAVVSRARSRVPSVDPAARSVTGSAAQAVERTIWSGADVPGAIADISPDSRLVAYLRPGRERALVVREIATGRDRVVTTAPGPLTPESSEYPVSASFSRDGRRLAYNWRIQRTEPGAARTAIVDELRVIDLAEEGVPTPHVLLRDDNTQGYGVSPRGWFPDDDRIVVQIGHGDERTRQLGYISVPDGRLTPLRTIEWRAAMGVSLSPDGRFLAFDLPANERTGQRDVFVLATDGTRLTTAVGGPTRDVVVGWSPDGTRLLFTRDDVQLWAQPMVDGAPVGSPSVVKASTRGMQFKLTAAGDLFARAAIDDRAFYAVSVDFESGRSTGSAAQLPGVDPASGAVAWSPDGTSVFSMYWIGDDLVLSVRSLGAGVAQLLSVPLSFFDNNNFDWAPDGRSILARAADMDGRLGFYRIDVADGQVTPVLLSEPQSNVTRPQLSQDGTKLFYIGSNTVPAGAGGQPTAEGRFYVERDLATGRERQIVQLDGGRPNGVYGGVSPDGQYIGVLGWSRMDGGRPAADAAWILSVISTADGTEREVFRAEPPAEFLGGPAVEWTPDSRFMIVRKVVGQATELWSVPVAGGPAHKLDLGGLNYTGKQIRISPDGREVVVQAGSAIKREFRVVERFLPAAR